MYRKDIDGLRAVAVGAVLIFHAIPSSLPGGSWGVDVFFVISGFLISSQIVRDLEDGTFSFVTFYAKRARRLLPALFIVLAACCIAGWFILLPQDFRSLGVHVLSGALYVSNFTLWAEVGYFDSAAAMKPLLHLWSLGVEEQFYLVWPLILIAAFRWRMIGPAIAAVTALSFLSAVLSPTESAFYLPWNRFWELGFGALLGFYGITSRSDVNGFLGVALIAGAIAMPEGHSPWIALLPTAGATLLIASPAGRFNRAVLSAWPAVAIGRISYQLYLWHWPPLVFARYYAGGELSTGASLALVAVALPLAIATLGIETALRRAPLRLPVLASGMAGAVLAVGIMGAFVLSSAGFPSRFAAEYEALLDAKPPSLAMRNRTCFLDATQPGGELDASCLEQGGAPLVLLWGDSHAAQIYPGLRALAAERGFRIAQITQSQCPFVSYIEFPSAPNCRSLNQVALDQIAALKPSIIIMATRWSLYSPWMPDNLWKLGFDVARSINETKGAHGKIIVLGSFPEWPAALPQIIKAKLSDGDFPARVVPTNDPRVRARAARLVDEAGVAFIDPFDVLCTVEGCRTTTPHSAQLTVYDESHLTPAAAEYFVRAALGDVLP